MKIKFCNKCQKETRHLGNRCFICNPMETKIPENEIINRVESLKDNPSREEYFKIKWSIANLKKLQ